MNNDEVINVVLAEYNGDRGILFGKTKEYPYPRIRQCISYILYAHCQLDYRRIKNILNYTDRSMAKVSANKYRDLLEVEEYELAHYNNILIELGLAKKTIALDDISYKFKVILENTVKELNLLIKSIE